MVFCAMGVIIGVPTALGVAKHDGGDDNGSDGDGGDGI
jgi:hypothetical protein